MTQRDFKGDEIELGDLAIVNCRDPWDQNSGLMKAKVIKVTKSTIWVEILDPPFDIYKGPQKGERYIVHWSYDLYITEKGSSDE